MYYIKHGRNYETQISLGMWPSIEISKRDQVLRENHQ
jgi:hypothetical protein